MILQSSFGGSIYSTDLSQFKKRLEFLELIKTKYLRFTQYKFHWENLTYNASNVQKHIKHECQNRKLNYWNYLKISPRVLTKQEAKNNGLQSFCVRQCTTSWLSLSSIWKILPPYWQNLELTLCHYWKEGFLQPPKPRSINISILTNTSTW